MDATELSDRLAEMAEAVCRHYLPNGHREGRSWRAGDARNAPGRSLTVRLVPSPDGRRAGKWHDLSTGEHGDLLDLIGEAKGLTQFTDVIAEARLFLADPPAQTRPPQREPPVASGSPEAAARLFRASLPLRGTLAETYLHRREILTLSDVRSLRFHPRCYYAGPDAHPGDTWPALIAAVTDATGRLVGVHRTYLDPETFDAIRLGKAPVDCPKRSMGTIHGHGVRFGPVADIMAAGEGIETVRSLKDLLPGMSMISALSSSHLADLALPAGLRHLYIVEDNDPAGATAAARLAARASAQDLTTTRIVPVHEDLNEDLRRLGRQHLAGRVAEQLISGHADRFLKLP